MQTSLEEGMGSSLNRLGFNRVKFWEFLIPGQISKTQAAINCAHKRLKSVATTCVLRAVNESKFRCDPGAAPNATLWGSLYEFSRGAIAYGIILAAGNYCRLKMHILVLKIPPGENL